MCTWVTTFALLMNFLITKKGMILITALNIEDESAGEVEENCTCSF
jgi:hypothetical protein